MRAALHDGSTVVNVIEYDPEAEYEARPGLTLIELPDDSTVGPGWRVDGDSFTAPPAQSLGADPTLITNAETSLVTYTDTRDDAPAQVTFTVNGAISTVALSDGIAELEVTPSAAGDIAVSVDQDVPGVTITVQEA